MSGRKLYFLPVLIYMFIGGAISYLLFHNAWLISAEHSPVASSTPCQYNSTRLKGYQYISPVLYEDKDCESERLASIKQEIASLADADRANGVITGASVYIHDLRQNDWVSYNDEMKYNPGSLLKVAILVTCLRKADADPRLLDREVVYDKPFISPKTTTFPPSQSMQVGCRYTLRQVLSFMVLYSDNAAASLATNYFSIADYIKTFSDLGLPEPDQTSPVYPITARQYSVLMEVLYNSSYLSAAHSEFAISLLSQSDFRAGLMVGVPASVKVAHKFGEEGNRNIQELHESGIVYLNNSPYIITVMTQGPDKQKLAPIIAEFSKLVFDYMSKNS